LIVFEGIDGSGKSTQFKMMCDRLVSENRQFRRVVFPRYDNPSSALIKMYLAGDFGNTPNAVNAYAASSFYAVDRFASFVQDWREYYESEGLILTDRYTTSNALHQGAKMAYEQRASFFEWLFDYEFNLIGLPKPDFVVYMDIDVTLAAERLRYRQTETGTSADIHEKDLVYLNNCAQSGRQAAARFGWHVIKCASNGRNRAEEDIHNDIYRELFGQ